MEDGGGGRERERERAVKELFSIRLEKSVNRAGFWPRFEPRTPEH
jgi:hypothetical protein